MNINFSKIVILLSSFTIAASQYLFSQEKSATLHFSKGAVNGCAISRNGKRLVIYGDPDNVFKSADMILFTDFRRDIVTTGLKLVQEGSSAVAPANEKLYFTRCDSIWKNFASGRFHDYYCQTTKFGIEPVKISRFVNGGDTIRWQGMDIRVVNTPGYTRGSVSYMVDADGKRYAFTGNMIYEDGKIPDLYSFQDSLRSLRGYHGYAIRLGQLISSLRAISEQRPDCLVPDRGPVINDPEQAIGKLIERISSLYRNYLAVSAYRWYSPEHVKMQAHYVLGQDNTVNWMPLSETICKNPPEWYRHIINTNLVVSEDSTAFLIDCGTSGALNQLMKMKKSGRIKSIDGVFITHYHDDHTDVINKIVDEFRCPVYVTSELKDILENPSAYRIPCLTTAPLKNLKIVENGGKMQWKEFMLTFFYFPGQTLYHDAVLFEMKNHEAVFFTGDSFTPSGMDDYCLLNRNFIHPGSGYFYCLNILRKLSAGVLLSNQHVEPLFAFSDKQLDFMEQNLKERQSLMKELLTWDNINYGLDEQWARIYPYGLDARPGQSVEFKVIIYNHSDTKKSFSVKPDLPAGFKSVPALANIHLEPGTEGSATFVLKVSGSVKPGINLITADLKSDNRELFSWSEALVNVTP
jgi:glyoxylase-like metal-dependent hydrolase (beta-lactamase superfamily II)